MASKTDPPSSAPVNAPTWWERNTTPKSMPMSRVPNMSAMRPEVSGTVDSHSSPVSAANTSTVAGVAGSTRNVANVTARPR